MFASSCDDFLTIYPTDKVILENYWKEKADVEGMVANCYRSMIQLGFMERFLVWGEVRSDNVMEGSNNNLSGSLKDVNEINLLPTNGYCSWGDFYKVINNCNIVMKYAPQVAELDPDYTSGDLRAHTGQMLAMRSLCHFYLVRTFRDIPLLRTAMIDDSQNLYQEQVGALEALDSIIVDLEDAYDMVMNSGGYATPAQNKGWFTKDAVAAILTDAYLWRASFTEHYKSGDAKVYYTQAIAWADRVIDARRNYIKQYATTSNGAAYKELATLDYPLVKSYVMDEIYNMMESGEASIAAYYAGDYFIMQEGQADDVDLKFYYPDETNYFFDSMCVPKCAENQELAEIFINFMLSEEAAIANAEYICYASPNSLVYESETYIEDMGEEAMEILYPPMDHFAEKYNHLAYRNLSNEMLSYMNTLWEGLKIN